MPELTAQRTLVKSPPELWEELSEVERLAKHLDAFGEIKITKLDPEHTVAWEGEHASGTVSIEQSGWGTKVVLTAALAEEPRKELDADGSTRDAGEGEPAARPESSANSREAEATEDSGTTADAQEIPGDRPQADEQETSRKSAQADAEEPRQENAEPRDEEAPRDPGPAETSLPDEGPFRRDGFWSRLLASWTRRRRWSSAAAEERPPGPAAEPVAQAAEPAEVPEQHPEPGSAAPSQAETRMPAPEGASDPEPAEAIAVLETATIDPGGAVAEPRDEPQTLDNPAAIDVERAKSVLDETLDALGSAHHRPFSRG